MCREEGSQYRRMRIDWVLGTCLEVTLLWVTAYSVRRLRGLWEWIKAYFSTARLLKYVTVSYGELETQQDPYKKA
jgi:hypothetical protein